MAGGAHPTRNVSRTEKSVSPSKSRRSKPRTSAARSNGRRGRRANFDELVGHIYDSALDPANWHRAMEGVADALGGSKAVLFHYDLESGESALLATPRIDPALWKPFEDYYSKVDPWKAALTKLPAGRPYFSQELAADAELIRTEIYNDLFAPHGIFHALGGFSLRTRNHAVTAGVLRPRGKPPFDDDDKRFFTGLYPHIARAAQLHFNFQGVRGALDAADDLIDRLPVGAILLDAAGRVVRMNRAAEEIVAGNDGLTVVRGRPVAALAPETAELDRLIGNAGLTGQGSGRHPGGAMAISRPSMRRPLSVLVSPLRANGGGLPFDFGYRRPACVVLVSDPERRHTPPADIVARLHGFTASEARLAVALLEHRSLKQAADHAGLTAGTARQYLKHLFHKTDTASQSELIKLLLSGPASLVQQPLE